MKNFLVIISSSLLFYFALFFYGLLFSQNIDPLIGGGVGLALIACLYALVSSVIFAGFHFFFRIKELSVLSVLITVIITQAAAWGAISVLSALGVDYGQLSQFVSLIVFSALSNYVLRHRM